MDDRTKSKLFGPKGRSHVSARVLDFLEAARASRRACHRLGVSVNSDDLQWLACFAAPLHKPPCDVAAAVAHIQHPDLTRRNTRDERGRAHDNASREGRAGCRPAA